MRRCNHKILTSRDLLFFFISVAVRGFELSTLSTVEEVEIVEAEFDLVASEYWS